MKLNSPLVRITLRLLLTTAGAFFVTPVSRAQVARTAPTAAQLAQYDKNHNGRLDPDELAALQADQAKTTKAPVESKNAEENSAGKDDAVMQLSPFEVTGTQDRGYLATNSLSGTRLNSKLEDLGASITVVTKQQLLDTAAVDINDVFAYESNTEGMRQYTEYSLEGGYNETTTLNPQSSNRVRGLGSANMAVSNFTASSTIPIDTYNVDAVEISRGPNANIFGLGGGSGTVNLIAAQANLTRENTQLTLRGDSYGGWRSNFDLNRPLIKNKLAVRVAGVHDEKGFERKPSHDETNRLTAAFTARPFKNTTIRGAFESYRDVFSRPNTTMPRDTFSEWMNNGKPVWNPLFNATPTTGLPTGGWRFLNGTTYTAVSAANEALDTAAGYPKGLLPNLNVFYARPSATIVDGVIQLYEMNRTNTTNAPGFGGATRYAESSGIRFGAFGVPAAPLFQPVAITDRGQYDYTSINFLSPNYGKDGADTYRAELEQFFLNTPRNQLAVQLGFYREKVDRYDHAFVSRSGGVAPTIAIDVNEFKFSGAPNPYFLRPYMSGSEPTINLKSELNDNERATLAYQLDLTGEKNLLHWLGKQRFASYGEYRRTINGSLSARERIVSDNPWVAGNDLLSLANRGVTLNMSPRYYLGGKVTDPGPIIDFAPNSPRSISGVHPFTWYGNNSTTPITENVTTDSVIYSGQKIKNEVRTEGLVWQGFLWNDRIVPTAGWRYDRTRQVNGQALNSTPNVANSTVNPTTRLNDLSYLDNYSFNPWVTNQGRTKTSGIVVKPFSWLNFHYNQSDSFQPANVAYNIYLQQLPNPQSNGKDYGFSLNLFDGKLVAKVNRYETVQDNSRSGPTGGSFAQRTFRFFFDVSTPLANYNAATNSFGNGNDPWDLEQEGTQWILAKNPGMAVETARQAAITQYLNPVGIDSATIDRVRQIGGSGFGETNTITSTGYEFELNYNPTHYWTMKVTAAEQKAIDSQLSQFMNEFFAKNVPYLQSIKDPITGGNWWTTTIGTSTTGAPYTWYIANIYTTLAQASVNAGKPRQQTREWSFTGATNFRFSGVTERPWLKNLAVGGAVHWMDKAAVGYYGIADPDGVIRTYDRNRPIYDKARYTVDLLASYDLRLFNKVHTRIQLNVTNVLENGRLQPIAYNPDGQAWNYRIIDPRQFILSTTFDL
jgi:hypothetical protein